jgi:hypothetical protein
MKTDKYRRPISWLITAWFVLALTASGLDIFQNPPSTPPIALGLAVLVPVLIFLAWYGSSQDFRAFVLSLDLRILTMLQSWRIAGFGFLALYTYKILPGSFALPAGWGDLFIGVTAPLIALKLTGRPHRAVFILWQILGMLDLVTAVGSGVITGFINHGTVTMDPITALPLSLIPTFGVPLFFIFHIISIAQARQWQAEYARQDVPLSSPGI